MKFDSETLKRVYFANMSILQHVIGITNIRIDNTKNPYGYLFGGLSKTVTISNCQIIRWHLGDRMSRFP